MDHNNSALLVIDLVCLFVFSHKNTPSLCFLHRTFLVILQCSVEKSSCLSTQSILLLANSFHWFFKCLHLICINVQNAFDGYVFFLSIWPTVVAVTWLTILFSLILMNCTKASQWTIVSPCIFQHSKLIFHTLWWEESSRIQKTRVYASSSTQIQSFTMTLPLLLQLT